MICLTSNLLPHQEVAVEKLRRLKVGALYMEQGTGKTRTTLELIKIRLDAGKIDKVLWFCPCSVKKNLQDDIIKHTGALNDDIIKICGLETLSSSQNTFIDLLDFVKNNKVFMIIDESNMVKNFKAVRTKRLIMLRQYTPYRILLNGTPVTKNEVDLFAQWYILDERILGYNSFYGFAANHIEYDDYGRVRRCLNVEYLTDKIAPYTYQITKAECLELKDKRYGIVYYSMTRNQYKEYDRVFAELLGEVDEFKSHTIYRMLTGVQNVISGLFVDCSQTNLISTPMFDKPMDNPRVRALDDAIAELNSNEKVLIFAKYTHEIESIVEHLCDKYGENAALPFYGEIKPQERQKAIDCFRDGTRFLVANKTCAGYGLNLQFCSTVIFYSNDYNYGTRIQAEDRVHRLGQDNDVRILSLCARTTLDENILNCLDKKESLVKWFRSELSDKKDQDKLEEIKKERKQKRKLTRTEIVWLDNVDEHTRLTKKLILDKQLADAS